MIEPLVSICCLTYNHEPYIRQCIEGFLMQKTSFKIEVLIHDDASTDKTADTIREYELKFPDLIRPIYQSENQYSKGIGVSRVYQFPRARGKYIALCEGDDYWIDPYKLKKQVDFLEANPEYGFSHGNTSIYYEYSGRWKLNVTSSEIFEEEHSAQELFDLIINKKYKIRTCTVLFRTELLESIKNNEIKFLIGDIPLYLDLSQNTKFKFFKDLFAVYRIVENSLSHKRNLKDKCRYILSSYQLRIYYRLKYNFQEDTLLNKKFKKALINYMFFDPQYKEVLAIPKLSYFERLLLRNINHPIVREYGKLKIIISDFTAGELKKLLVKLKKTIYS